MKRTIGVERLFSLGKFKNIRFIESIEIPDDEGMTEDDLDILRSLSISNVYMSFAAHQLMLENINEVDWKAEDVIRIIKEERDRKE